MKKQSNWLFLALIISLAGLMALTSCSSNMPENTNPENAPPDSASPTQAEESRSTGEINVTIEDLPGWICIGDDYQITIGWTDTGEEIVDGNFEWTIDYSRAAQGTTSDFQHRKAIFMTMDNSPQKEPVSAIVKIDGAEYASGLVEIDKVIGETKQEAEFIYCENTLSLGYQGSYTNGIFEISENASMGVPVRVNEENGQITGEGALELTVVQTINQQGVSCDVIWEGAIPVSITGKVSDGQIKLAVGSESRVIEDSTITCTAEGQTISVPAAGGPINLGALGLESLSFSTAGGTLTSTLSSGVFTGGSGGGEVTVVLEPKME